MQKGGRCACVETFFRDIAYDIRQGVRVWVYPNLAQRVPLQAPDLFHPLALLSVELLVELVSHKESYRGGLRGDRGLKVRRSGRRCCQQCMHFGTHARCGDAACDLESHHHNHNNPLALPTPAAASSRLLDDQVPHSLDLHYHHSRTNTDTRPSPTPHQKKTVRARSCIKRLLSDNQSPPYALSNYTTPTATIQLPQNTDTLTPPIPCPPVAPVRSCIKRLLSDDQSPRAEDVECLCKLLGTVGQQLESPQVKGRAGMSQTDVSVGRHHLCVPLRIVILLYYYTFILLCYYVIMLLYYYIIILS
jgi:hypothetical protein